MTELEVNPEELTALAGLFAPDHVADPYPVYARWRERQPVARPHEYLFVLSRYEDCAAVLGDPAWGHSPANGASPLGAARRAGAGGAGRAAADDNERSLLRLNPPDHTRLRRLVSRAFTPASVRALAPRIEARVEVATALRHLLPILPQCEIAQPPSWKPHTVLRGMEHLWLTSSR